MKTFLLFCLLVLFSSTESAKILGLFYSTSKSHHIMGEVIFKELAKKGHEVTMMSPFPLKQPVANYTDVFLHELLEGGKEVEKKFIEMFKNPSSMTWKLMVVMDKKTQKYTEVVFKSEGFKQVLESGQKFDVIIMDMFFNDAHFVLSHIFDAPIIVCATAGTNDLVNKVTRNPFPYAYVPNKFLPYSDEMNFLERLSNTLVSLLYYISGIGTRGHHEILERNFPDAPPLEKLQENVALVLSNSHVSFETPRPSVPSIISVGGCHVEPPNKLPTDLQEFLDSAKEGAILFSLGSNMKSSFLRKDDLRNILKAFSKTKLKVLMKWEDEVLPNKSANVEIRRWLPQGDILTHPNMKIFITHGGLMSTIETIYHAVPIIGIPVYADQHSNVHLAVVNEYGLKVDFSNMTENNLLEAINEIARNNKYKKNIQMRSDLLRNQPIKPLDLAIYWIEHVIRHKGAPHLQTKAHKLAWYQILLLDVVLFLSTIVLIIVGIAYFILKNAVRFFCTSKRSTTNKNKLD